MTARYDAVADTYAAGLDDLSNPAAAALLDLGGSIDGDRVLNLACGHGVVARELARRGASVVGLDLSGGLLDRARTIEDEAPLGITYVQASATDASALAGERFDVVVSNFGLSDIDDLDGACATVARVLEPGGRFVFSILHPCFAGDEQVSGAWPTEGTYYDEGWWRADGALSTLRREVGANHRMLSTYVNAPVRHGLTIDEVIEPREPAWAIDRPTAAAQPVYLVVRAIRSPEPVGT